MSEKKVALIVNHMLEKKAPRDEIDLLPRLQKRFQASASIPQRRWNMKTQTTSTHRLHLAAWITATLILAFGLFLATPQGRAFAQSVVQFFTRTESDRLPVQAFQLTPVPATIAPDPGDINNANLTISQVKGIAGYPILQPVHLPEGLTFIGATFDPEKHTSRLFFRDADMNALVLREELFQLVDDCDLCGKVGASAKIEAVQIKGLSGAYGEGVWKLTEAGAEWVSDPYLKTLRWQDTGMAFELLYMGIPDSLTKKDMIDIAESIQ